VIEEGLPFGLPGYEGFLSRWAVSFNAYMGYVVVERPRTSTSASRTTPCEEMLHRLPRPLRATAPSRVHPARAAVQGRSQKAGTPSDTK